MKHQSKMVEMGVHVCFLNSKNVVLSLAVILLISVKCANSAEEKPDEKWKKKDIRDYTDADLERLLDQWEVTCLLFQPITIPHINIGCYFYPEAQYSGLDLMAMEINEN